MALTEKLEETLERELLEAKKSLQGVDHDLNKLLGRDPSRMKRRLSATSPRLYDDQREDGQADSHEDEPEEEPGVFVRGVREFMPRTVRMEREDRSGGGYGSRMRGGRGDYRGGRWTARSVRGGGGFGRGGGVMVEDDGGPAAKRRPDRSRNGHEFGVRQGRWSPSPEADSKPAIQSHIVGPSEISADDSKSRQMALLQRKNDKENINRSRRMFGALLGTLQKFRSDEIKLKDKEEKRAVVERKLEDDARKERVELRQQKSNMLAVKKRKQQELKLIEMKTLKVKEEKEWETYQFRLMNFARTQCQPYIFFQPKLSHPNTDEMLQKTKQRITEDISVQRERLADELSLLDSRLNRLQRVSEMDTTSVDNTADMETTTTTTTTAADASCQQLGFHDNSHSLRQGQQLDRTTDDKSLPHSETDDANDDSDDERVVNSDSIVHRRPSHRRHRRDSAIVKHDDKIDSSNRNGNSDYEREESSNGNGAVAVDSGELPVSGTGEPDGGNGEPSDGDGGESREAGEIPSDDVNDV